MSSNAAGLVATLVGIVMLVLASSPGARAESDARLRVGPPGNAQERRRTWLAVAGIAFLCIGLCLRYASVPFSAGLCYSPSGESPSAHCFHGAPWPPHGTSR